MCRLEKRSSSQEYNPPSHVTDIYATPLSQLCIVVSVIKVRYSYSWALNLMSSYIFIFLHTTACLL